MVLIRYIALIVFAILMQILNTPNTPATVPSKDDPGNKKHGEKIKEGIFLGFVRTVDIEYGENYDEIDEIIEHNLIEWLAPTSMENAPIEDHSNRG